jgi:L-amino acid N-acyltransferase YncA
LAVLFDHARTKGLRRMHGAVLAKNRKMLALARQLGFVIKGNPEDALLPTVTLDVAAPPDVGAAHEKGASTSA